MPEKTWQVCCEVRPSSHPPDAPAASSAAITARFGHLIADSSSKARASLRQLKDPGRGFVLAVGSVGSPLLPKGTLGVGKLRSHMVGLQEAGEPSEKNSRQSAEIPLKSAPTFRILKIRIPLRVNSLRVFLLKYACREWLCLA